MRTSKINAATSLILVMTTVSAAQDSLNVTKVGEAVPWNNFKGY